MRRMTAAAAIVATVLVAVPSVSSADTKSDHSIKVYTGAPGSSAPMTVRAGDLAAPPGVSADGPGRYYGTFEIVSMHNGRCLDAHQGDGGGNGNRVGLWDCNDGPTTRWHIYDNLGGGTYWMTAINAGGSNRALDYPAASGGAIGWQYILWDYLNSPGQRFWPYERGGPDTGIVEFEVARGVAGSVMDAFASDGGGNGNRVGNWTRTGDNRQLWYFRIP